MQAAEEAAAAAASLDEMHKYLEEPLEDELDINFDVLQYWRSASTPKRDAETGVIIYPAKYPLLSILARRYFSIDATSCQAERNFSDLGQLYTKLRRSLLPHKIERLMFLHLSKHLIPAVAYQMNLRKAAEEQAADTCMAIASTSAAAAAAASAPI